MPGNIDTQIAALRAHDTSIRPGDHMAEAARKALVKDLLQLREHEAGFRAGGSAVNVHKMRVATRRMRATFLLLGKYFKPKVVTPFQRDLRRLGRALGSVRDLDVMIDRVARFQTTLNENGQASLIPALAVLDEQRAAASRQLAETLDKKAYARFVRDFGEFVTTPNARTRTTSDKQPYPPEARYMLPIEVYRHVATIRAYDRLIDTADNDTLHTLRIEFKRLRYLIAIFSELLGKRGKDVIEELKSIQDHLGALNDAAVTRQRLPDLLPGFADGASGVLESYLARLEAEEAALRDSFPAVWKRFNSPAMQRRLAGAVAGL
ncbi:MAG: CHAD domain-containing protein [Chloroflexota bacterium]|nr:MAG: hypothetical protein DIU68_19480 [Chloroflexota bacterium]